MERGLRINKQVLDDNMSSETLVAQRIVHEQMLSHNSKPDQIEISSRIKELVKNARKSYFLELKEKGLNKLKTSVNVQRGKLNEEIADTNCQSKFLESTVEQLKGCVRYIFASLFCISKGEHLRNKEKCVLFPFKSSSRF